MRYSTLVAVLVVVIPVVAEEPKKDAWVKVMDAGKFEAEFPVKPTEKETTGGKQFIVQKIDPVTVYNAVGTTIPARLDLGDAKTVKAMLDPAVESTANGLKGKVLSDKATKFADKYPAREVDIEAPGIGIFRCKMVLTPAVFVQLTVAGSREIVEGADAKRFFGSLKLKD